MPVRWNIGKLEYWNNEFRERKGNFVFALIYHHSILPLFHYSKVLPLASAGLHTDTTDIMAEVEGFGKSFQLFMASKVIEVLMPFLNRSCWAYREAVLTGAAVFKGRSVEQERKVGKDSDEANPRPKILIDEEVIPSDPSQPCCLCHMLMGEMTFLTFPIHNL